MNCKAVTKAGNPCLCRVVRGTDTCFSHSEAGVAQRLDASLKSAEARRERRERREMESERADLTLTQRIKLAAADKADDLSAALVAHAIAFPNSAAMAMVLDRTEGKVANEHRIENLTDPFTMTQAQLEAWLAEPARDED